MESALCFSFSEVFDRHPSMNELVETVQWIPLRHAIHVISTLNLAVRYAMHGASRQNFGKVQEILILGHIDDEILSILKARFPNERCDKRPIFLPQNLLPLLRIVIAHCNPDLIPNADDEARVRYAIGRACLMMNNLLFTEDEVKALTSAGAEDDMRIKLMAQAIGGFELTNPPRPDHLIPRLQIMYRILLNDPQVRSRIAQRCEGLDFANEFETLVGIGLERWLFIVFAIYAYFINGADPLDPHLEYVTINPEAFRGESGIAQSEFELVLKTLSTSMPELKLSLECEKATDPRHDFVAFRSRPLIRVEDRRLMPADVSFIVDKCHSGVQWTMHDLLPPKRRRTVFTAWGVLFEEYVHWLLRDMETRLPLKYVPSPKWRDNGNESFDGVLTQGRVFVPGEYKGGFLARAARYSGRPELLLEEIEEKFAPGCDQLADKIGALFAEDPELRRELVGLPVEDFQSIVPVLVVQDHILRVPLLNWYLNKRFQMRLKDHAVRPDAFVRPLTVVNIHDLESAVHSIEGENFDFIYAIHNRTIRDAEVLSDLGDHLRLFPNYGNKPSPRIKRVLGKVQSDWSSYLFPNEHFSTD